MKRKPVPAPPASLDALETHRAALPLVPGSEDDCCARLQTRAGVADRPAAGEWLEFLCALGLARDTASGFVRTRDDLDRETLASNFLDGVVLAEAVVSAVATAPDPVSVDSVFDQVHEGVPRWERRKRDDWRDHWREQLARRLDWAVLLGLADRIEADPPRYTV